jgi:hypothetical protein
MRNISDKIVEKIKTHFRCTIPVVFWYTARYELQVSHNTTQFFVVLFKLTTCFGLCFRPSSGNKIYINNYTLLPEDGLLKQRTKHVVWESYTCKMKYTELNFNEISLNFNSIYLILQLTFYSFFKSHTHIYIYISCNLKMA